MTPASSSRIFRYLGGETAVEANHETGGRSIGRSPLVSPFDVFDLAGPQRKRLLHKDVLAGIECAADQCGVRIVLRSDDNGAD